MTEQMAANEMTDTMLFLISERGVGKTICPSEVARHLDPENWRDLMDAVRNAAIELAHQNRLQIMQKVTVVNPDNFRGPIRLGLPEPSAS